ncbi:MAG: TerC family protein [Thermosynechococcus sp.]|uniref:TerC family protein n=1 Tax=Thermosynechococcus sp. TaxID=2814275 RepID=UPI00391BE592
MIDKLLDLSPNWGLDTLLLLVVLLALEAVLSADNAIALAALVRGIEDLDEQRRALNLGLAISYIFRIALIFTATWVLQFWQFELAGALYLLWLAAKYFFFTTEPEHHHERVIRSFWQAVPLLALADLAFSLDSVTTAIALSDERWLVLLGGTIGVIMLRFMAELFIRWLKEFPRLEDAGYFTVTLVGLRLLIRVINPQLVPSDWVMITLIALCFTWGFSKREVAEPETPPTLPHSTQEPTSHTPKR